MVGKIINNPAASKEQDPSPERFSLLSSFLARGFPCVWGVWESWKWDELQSGGGGAVGEQRRSEEDGGLWKGPGFVCWMSITVQRLRHPLAPMV